MKASISVILITLIGFCLMFYKVDEQLKMTGIRLSIIETRLNSLELNEETLISAVYKLYKEGGYFEGRKGFMGGSAQGLEATAQATSQLAEPESGGQTELWKCHQVGGDESRFPDMDCVRLRQPGGKAPVWRCYPALGDQDVERNL
jgi:hypothetical protein